MAGLGVISLVYWFEMYYEAGFTAYWWGAMTEPALIVLALSGWVVYRFRQTRAMTLALQDAQLDPTEVDYINAHGTSTQLGDQAETTAVKNVFKEHARKVALSSTKSQLGHLLGASGGVELILTILAIERGLIPPTINYQTPDPTCDLDYTPNTPRERKVTAALSNSFGFGGHNACAVFKSYDG